ncbi:MAG TPA: isoprenylcysteine carboxylmethyltransferase family protein [Terriglobales bacterium]|jgi:protein-S-isoprenylcysteine O-methyltransferase Ste14
MLSALHTLGWVACVGYSTVPSFWLLIHPRAEYWRSRRRSPYRILLPLWMTMWLGAGAITWPWRRVTLYSTLWTWIPAVLLFATGIALYVLSARHFSGKQLGGLPEVLRDQRRQALVTVGIRARVRHPVYLGHLCEMLAWSMGTGLVVCCLLTAFALVTGYVMIRLEDRELEIRFGDEYRAYRRQVPALLPKL